jgi:uncharacterized protein YndB with AHSA1/START domain
MAIGEIFLDGDTHTIRFERTLPFAPERVWAALTEPAALAEWLADATVLPGEGGQLILDFGEGGREAGRITVWVPPRALAYEWNFTGGQPSQVQWWLTATEDGRTTLLTLEHRLLRPDVSPGYGAGWHAHLDQLEGHLAGSVPEWAGRYEELRPLYQRAADAMSASPDAGG